MKYVFLDSNTFFNQWHLNNADLSLLSDFLKNSHSVLLMSELVCEEVQNLHQREQKKQLSELKKNYEKAQKFNKEKIPYSFDNLVQPYDFKELLKQKMEFVELFAYEAIPQKVVTARAIARTLPFRENEKGYRDTLIWLSLLEYLKTKTVNDTVAFITQNVNDFYSSEETKFHEDLSRDLKDHKIHCDIKVYATLNEFVKAEIETNENEFSNDTINEQFIDQIPHKIEAEIETFLVHLPTNEFKKLLDASGLFFRYTTSLSRHDFQIDEGIEDGLVIGYKRLSATELYINYSFNLRRCEILLTISEAELASHKTGIQLFYHDAYIAEDEGYLIYYCRPDFMVSFVYNTETENVSGFELLKLGFMS